MANDVTYYSQRKFYKIGASETDFYFNMEKKEPHPALQKLDSHADNEIINDAENFYGPISTERIGLVTP